MVELGTVWLLMVVLNQDPGPAFLSGNISVESYEPKGMSSIQGAVAFDLASGKEKIWAELTTRVDGKPRHQILIFRFDTGSVYRLDPEKRTYAELPVKDSQNLLAALRMVYLGPGGKRNARTIPPPKGVTETRTCKQVDADRFTTIFYIDPMAENAVTRIDVSSNADNVAVVNKLENPDTKPVPPERFEIPAGYKKTK